MNIISNLVKFIRNFIDKRKKEKQERTIDSQRRSLFNSKLSGKLLDTTEPINFKILSTKLKFDLNPKMVDGKLKINIESKHFTEDEIKEILNAYNNKKELKHLLSGKEIDFSKIDFDHLKEQLSQYNQKIENVSSNFEIANSNIFMLASKSDAPIEAKKFVEKFNNYKPTFLIPKKIKNWLRDYQKEGYLWMKKLLYFDFGCLLADDMGLGKTVQTILIVIDTLAQNKNARILIVCPLSLVYNWEKEIKQHCPDIKVGMVLGSRSVREKIVRNNQCSIYITPTTSVWRDQDFYNEMNFDLLVLDEAQSIKNENTNIAKGLKKIVTKKRLALTGTPIENHLGELWSIMDFLNPGILGTKRSFFDCYEKPILEGDLEKQENLQKITRPFYLRRTKDQVLHELPEKIVKIHTIEFNKEEENLYHSIVQQSKKEFQQQANPNKSYALIFKLITMLRQTCCDARLIGMNHHSSSKLNFLIEKIHIIIEEDSKNKIIVFSQFTSMLDLIRLELERYQIKYHLLTGKDKTKDRLKKVEDFNGDNSNVFLISLKAGGTGLNITSANYVFHYDPWWNLAAENQATDRAHRMGQKRVVFVNKLIIKNTLEEKIIDIQNRKFELFKTFVESEGTNTKMDLKSLKEIIGL